MGNHEIDLLPIRPSLDGLKCRHVEIQASVHPRDYIIKVPKQSILKVRDVAEMRAPVRAWVTKKYHHPGVRELRDRLAVGSWSRELVVHNVKYRKGRVLLEEQEVKVHYFCDVVDELRKGGLLLDKASGESLVDLVLRGAGGAE